MPHITQPLRHLCLWRQANSGAVDCADQKETDASTDCANTFDSHLGVTGGLYLWPCAPPSRPGTALELPNRREPRRAAALHVRGF